MGLLLGLGSAVLAVGSTAAACTNLASINLSATSGKPGDAIVITGSGFMGSSDDPAMAEMGMADMKEMPMGSTAGLSVRPPVVLRWNGAEGPILSNAIPDKSGAISVTITIPQAQAGHYTVMAIQKNQQGFDVYGTPARAPLQVTPDGRPLTEPLRPAGVGAAGNGSNPIGLIVLTAGVGVLGLGLLVAAAVLTVRQVGRRRVPARVANDPANRPD